MSVITDRPASSYSLGAPAPLDSDERLHVLDILRGLALAGMILVHFHQRVERPSSGPEDLIGWAIWILAEQKAWGTFAFLFGAGFAVLLRRLEARGASVVPVYLRRMAGLALFGVVIEVGFGFTVLLEYAGWGLVLLAVRRWPTRALLALAVVAACARPVVTEWSALWTWWTAAPAPAGFDRTLWNAAHEAAKQSSYVTLLAARWALFVGTLPHRWKDFLPNSNLTLFILGLLAIRHRVIDEPLRHVRLIVGWMIFGAVSWALAWTVLFNLPSVSIPGADWPLAAGLGLVQDQWLTLTYVGAVVLLLARRPVWVARLRPFGASGRMALTNYLGQAAFFDVIGSGYGLGLQFRPIVHVFLWPLVVAAQIVVSRAWLKRFLFGPMEWVWRCITYARWQPLRRPRAVVATADAAAG